MSEAAARAQPKKVPLVHGERLSKLFRASSGLFSRERFVRAVDGVTIFVKDSETLGLVGESGSGKSTLGRLLLRLTPPTYGRVHFQGRDITELPERKLRPLRRHMQIVFQDPWSSLNPRLTVKEIIAEGIEVHRILSGKSEVEARVEQLLKRVGLHAEAMHKYPHEFSGGQRQRIGIARALACEPRFIVCDEPLSALDVSIQAQIVNLLMDLQQEYDLSFLFVSHDLKIVEHVSHRVAVMYLGRIVEVAPVASLYEHRHHPYTRALLSAVPRVDPTHRRLRVLLPGEPPSPIDPPPGCAFHPRCPRAEPGRCDVEAPDLAPIEASSRHRVACFHPYV